MVSMRNKKNIISYSLLSRALQRVIGGTECSCQVTPDSDWRIEFSCQVMPDSDWKDRVFLSVDSRL